MQVRKMKMPTYILLLLWHFIWRLVFIYAFEMSSSVLEYHSLRSYIPEQLTSGASNGVFHFEGVKLIKQFPKE